MGKECLSTQGDDKKYGYSKLNRKSIKYSLVFLLSFIIISHAGYACAYATTRFGTPVSARTLTWFYPLKVDKFLSDLGCIVSDKLDSISFGRPDSEIKYPLNEIETTRSIPGYNIIHILINSWNPDVYGSDVCPYMASFARRGQTFCNHVSSHNTTQGSIFSFFTGIPFSYEEDFSERNISPLFIDKLIDNNYDIEIFSSSDFTGSPLHETVFKRVPDISTCGKGETAFERDIDITERFTEFLVNRDMNKLFYSFLFYDLPHSMNIPVEQHVFEPCWQSPQYTKLSNSMDRSPFYNLHKNCVHYTDKLIGEILDKIEIEGLLENTIILITGDHGQEFNENKKNYWGHTSNYSKWQIQVPFIIYYPGIEQGKSFDHMTTHYDVSTTLLNRFLGVKNPPSDYSVGYDLWDSTCRYPIIVGNYVEQGYVLDNVIAKIERSGKMQVFDKEMNEVSQREISVSELKKGVQRRNIFFK